MSQPNDIPRKRAINRVLIVSIFLNAVVAISKVIVGVSTGSIAIIADGFHSLGDGSSSVIGLIAHNIASRPPDTDHPYGHQRFETLATLAIGILLVLTAWETLKGIIERIGDSATPNLTPLAFGVMIFTLFVNIGINRYQAWVGRKLNSDLLLADASHTAADIFVTLSVLFSMALTVSLGWAWVDIVAASVVVVLILRAAWQILSRSGRILVDTAPYPPELLTELALRVPEVFHVVRARSRGTADHAYIDLDVQASPTMTTRQAARIADAVTAQLHHALSGVAEVAVRFVPDSRPPVDYALAVRALADPLGLRTHNVVLSRVGHSYLLDLHVEVPAGQTLAEAHAAVTRLEEGIRRDLPQVREVASHIEPLPSTKQAHACVALSEDLCQKLHALLSDHFPQGGWHDLSLHRQSAGLNVVAHAYLPPHLPIESAHDLAEQAERFLRGRLPTLNRVTIHTEPHPS